MSKAQRSLAIWGYAAPLGQAFFYAPIFFLYWNSLLTVERVLQLEAIYYMTVVLLEVPSGYFSDRVGRIATLRISAVFGVLAYGLFFLGDSFASFALAQVSLAAHFSFRSGTDTAWHYDLLEVLGLEAEFADREARLARVTFWVRSFCALVGGAVGSFALGVPYALSCAAAAVVAVLMFASSELPQSESDRAGSFGRQIGRSVSRLANPWLAWIFGYVVLQTTLEHVPYEFAQPYVAAVLGNAGADVSQTPLATGVIVAIVALIGGWAAGLAPVLQRRLGVAGTLLALTTLQTVVIALLAAVVHPVLVVLLMLRSIHPAIGHVVVNVAIAPRIPRSERATYLSLHSLAGRAGYSTVLLSLGALVGGAEVMEALELRQLLGACALLAVIGLVALLAARRRAEAAMTAVADTLVE